MDNAIGAHRFRQEQLDLTCFWDMTTAAEHNLGTVVFEAWQCRDGAVCQACGWDMSHLYIDTGHFDCA